MEKNINNNQKKNIKIGDVFFIRASDLCSWIYADEVPVFSSSGKSLDEDDMLIVVKYLGNGVIEEMITHEKILISDFLISDVNFEDDSELVRNVYADYFKEHEKVSETDIKKYLNTLESLKQTAFKYPIIFRVVDAQIYDVTDDRRIADYLLVSDNVRKQKMFSLKKIALERSKEFIKVIDSFIINFDYNDELTGDEMLDEAYLENKIFEFKRETK